jgi:hypothetical protein
MKTTLTIAAIVLVGVGLMWWGRANQAVLPDQSGNNKESPLIAEEKSYDFGSIRMKDGNVIKEFTVTNPTGEDVTVKTVLTSCMCTTAYLIKPDGSSKGPFGMAGHGGAVPPANELVKAGESRTVRVVFDPNAHGPAGVGQIDRLVMLTDSEGGTLELEIKALVTP